MVTIKDLNGIALPYSELSHAEVIGTLSSDLIKSKVQFDENDTWYDGILDVSRKSGSIDSVRVMLPKSIYPEIDTFKIGDTIRVSGVLGSMNCNIPGVSHLVVYVKATRNPNTIQALDPSSHNIIHLIAKVSREPDYRKTPFGREITDCFLSVNTDNDADTRDKKNTVFVPVITWGGTARFARKLIPGDILEITGRLQSRKYFKRTPENPDGTEITTYEISTVRARKFASSSSTSSAVASPSYSFSRYEKSSSEFDDKIKMQNA